MVTREKGDAIVVLAGKGRPIRRAIRLLGERVRESHQAAWNEEKPRHAAKVAEVVGPYLRA